MFSGEFIGEEQKKAKEYYDSSAVGESNIQYYDPNAGLRPLDYVEPEYVTQFFESFEKRCLDFLSKTQLTEDNFNYMDALVKETIEFGVRKIETQSVQHCSTIEVVLSKLRSGDRIKYESKLKQYREEIELVRVEKRKYIEILHKGTVLEQKNEERDVNRYE